MATELEALAAAAAERAAPRLSAELLLVLRDLAAGYTSQQIAHHLHVSDRTVTYRIQRIHDRLHTSTRPQAVYVATRLGLLEGVPTP